MTTKTAQAQPRPQNIVPVTVEGVLACKDPQFQLYGTQINIVWLVGIIRQLKVESCEISCYLQDHQHAVKCIMHLETDSEAPRKLNGIRPNSYAKIFGFVRNEAVGKVVTMLKMVPVDDANVVTNHLLQALNFAVEAKATRKKQLESANTSGAALADSLAMTDDDYTETQMWLPEPEISDFQRVVFDIVRSECSEDGITKRNILMQFPLYQQRDVSQALDFLVNQGSIYYTIDMEHLKVTNSY